MTLWVRVAVGVVILLAIGSCALTLSGVPARRAMLTASARAVGQLAIVALALRGVFAAPVAAVAVLAVMFGVVVRTAGKRLRAHAGALGAVALSCGVGGVVTVGVIVGMPVLTRDTRTLVAVSGIVLGGTMTAATLTGRRLADGLRLRRPEVEAWLAIGATPREAIRDIARTAVFEALVPALDQTRTVGLVTLPGAFVGALLGGVSAAEAARFQIVVLVGLLCAETLTATVLAHLIGAPAVLPE
jgi:putative ABC transport system permease protein